MVSQLLEYPSDKIVVALEVFLVSFAFLGSRMDSNVIHVYCYTSFVNQVPEDGVHHGLERGWGVGEAEEHDSQFV